MPRDIIRNRFSCELPPDVPYGILFYPCVGRDTFFPIRCLIRYVSDFYFVEVSDINILPNFECRKDIEYDPRRKTIHLNLVKNVVSFPPYEDHLDEEKIAQLRNKRLITIGYRDKRGKINKYELKLFNDRVVNVYWHVQDGLAAFTSIENISIFFLRRDSAGEEGSGQGWFREEIFRLILDKLLDGGLIITDGSSTYFETLDLPWKGFWEKKADDKGNNLPNEFSCYGRSFKCLGIFGPGYGPTLIWQVKKI
jgi:hypothetical protein